MKKEKTREEIIKELELAETEEGRTGLVKKFLEEEKKSDAKKE